MIRCEPAGVCDTLYGQARIGLYRTFPEQHVRVLVFQFNLGTFTHRHLKWVNKCVLKIQFFVCTNLIFPRQSGVLRFQSFAFHPAAFVWMRNFMTGSWDKHEHVNTCPPLLTRVHKTRASIILWHMKTYYLTGWWWEAFSVDMLMLLLVFTR